MKDGKECHKCKKVGHLASACLTPDRTRRHSWSDNRSSPRAESNAIEAGAATCWGYDANWVHSLIESTIHNDAIDARASAVTAVSPEFEEENYTL